MDLVRILHINTVSEVVMRFKGLTDRQLGFCVKSLVVFSVLYFGYSVAAAETIKVAVIDTGFDFDSKWNDKASVTKPKLCPTGHKDFTDSGIKDTHGHGTHIAGLVGSYAGNADYCIIVIKYYDEKSNGENNLNRSIQAIKYAKELKVDFINYSGGGNLPSVEEKNEVVEYLNQGGNFISAAGNKGMNIDLMHFYPANYDSRVVVVGATSNSGKLWEKSNHGDSLDLSVIGKDVLSILPDNKYGFMSGTSQATAKITGILVFKKSILTPNRSISRDGRTAN